MIKFDINFVFGLIDLIVFYLLMKKFLFGRIKKVMDARKELIASQLKEAEDKSLEADRKLEEYENKIASCDEEGEQIISDAKKKAHEEYNRIVDDAKSDAEKLRQNAQKQIAEQTEKAKLEAKEELASLAIEAAEKVIGGTVDAKANSAIFDSFLNEENND